MNPLQRALQQSVGNANFSNAPAVNPYANAGQTPAVPLSTFQTQQLPAGVVNPLASQQTTPYFTGQIAKTLSNNLPTPQPTRPDIVQQALGMLLNRHPQPYSKAATVDLKNGIPTPTPQVLSAATKAVATPTPTDPNEAMIRNGFMKFNPDTPAATLSASFARAGKGLPDPLMPAVLSLKETGGGKHMADQNNLLNIQYNGINNSPYEKPEYSIEGGGGHKGFPGVINGGAYADYLKSGDLKDFFKVYTPTYDKNGNKINDSIEKQVSDYNKLRSLFTAKGKN